MAKQSKAKQRFEERRRHNQIVAQLQGLKDQGFTDDQIRNAGKNAYAKLSGQTPATTPATATPTYSAAPAWAQTAYNPNPGASLQASTPQPPLQWWQRQQQAQQNTRPTANSSPFASVTGSAGGTSQPTATGIAGLAQRAATSTPQNPYVPAWLSWWRDRTPTGVAGLATQNRRPKTTPTATTAGPTMPAGNPGTTGNRTPNPLTGIPDFPMLSSLGEAPYTGGYNWKRRRRGRGGGRSGAGWYAPREQEDRQPYVPSSGQANWSIG